VIIYVLFGVIIIVFVFTFNVASPDVGCGGSGGRGAALAKVADVDLDSSSLAMGLALSADPVPPGAMGDPKAFQAELLYRTTRFARFRGDSRFGAYTPDPRSVSGLKVRKVMDDLEETYLIAAEAERLGLDASPEEVRERIVADFSSSGGEFKRRSYEDWVRFGLRTSLQRFEDFVRREILREKLIALLVASVTVPEREARLVASLRKNKRTYEYIEVNPTAVADAFAAAPTAAGTYVQGVPPSAEEIATFLKEDEAEARRYYDDHKEELGTPATFDLRLLRFAAPSQSVLLAADAETRKGLEETRSAQKAKAEAALKGLEGRTDLALAFEEAGRQADEHGSLRKGVAIGELEKMDKALAQAVKDAEVGKPTGVIEGDDAFFVVLVEGRTEGRERPFDEVKGLIATRILAARKAKDGVEKLLAAVHAKALGNPKVSLADVAAEVNAPFGQAAPVHAGETGDVSAMPATLSGLLDYNPDALPGIGESAELVAAARGLSMDKPVADRTFKVGDSHYVIRLKSVADGSEPSPEDIAAVRQELLPIKRVAYYREWYQRLKADAAAKGLLVEREAFAKLVRSEAQEYEEAAKRAQKKAEKGQAVPKSLDK